MPPPKPRPPSSRTRNETERENHRGGSRFGPRVSAGRAWIGAGSHRRPCASAADGRTRPAIGAERPIRLHEPRSEHERAVDLAYECEPAARLRRAHARSSRRSLHQTCTASSRYQSSTASTHPRRMHTRRSRSTGEPELSSPTPRQASTRTVLSACVRVPHPADPLPRAVRSNPVRLHVNACSDWHAAPARGSRPRVRVVLAAFCDTRALSPCAGPLPAIRTAW